MRNTEQSMIGQDEIFAQKQNSEKEKRMKSVLRYIEKRVIGANEFLDDEDAIKEKAKYYQEIAGYYKEKNSREKADFLYEKLMAYMLDKQAEAERRRKAEKENQSYEAEKADPYLISEIKVLFEDEETKRVFAETYSEARIDAKVYRISELGKLWENLNKEIQEKEEEYKKLEQDLYLKRIKGAGKISVTESKMSILAKALEAKEKRKKELKELEGLPKTGENTDIVANFEYEELRKYKEQLDKGFVWLPSRKQIHKETVNAILNHRWPVLVGEAGTGKSNQANAASIELTGYLPTEIECENNTGEKQLIKDISIDPETGGSYEEYGALMRAFTGYENSNEKNHTFDTGRIARFDESGRLGPKAYAIIKKARQKKTGDDFYGKKMLPGASAIWTTNPVGPRYPDRYATDPAMRRELAEIWIDYSEMSKENPELYEFMITALLDENNHISIAKKELAPTYEKKELPEDKRETIEDGSIIIAKDELIEDFSDARHGALWRFAGAIKALQDSFIYGNAETESYPESLLRFKEDADGNIEIVKTGGEPLTLSTSTVTLGELSSWMQGFNERLQKQDADFRTNTLSEWLDFKIKTYLKQADKADRLKIEAIFKQFHFLEGDVPKLENEKPLTPKEIGYLSPRVPRPVYVEKPKDEKKSEEDKQTPKELKEYETTQVLLENGERVLLKVSGLSFESGEDTITAGLGVKFRVGAEDFTYAGVVEDEKSEHNGKPVGKFAGEELYRVFEQEELDRGIFSYETEELIKDINENLPKMVKDCWKMECVGNIENNPDNLSL